MPTLIDPTAYVIGAAEIYYRAIGSTGAWSNVGSTVDDAIFRVKQSMFNPSDQINGLQDLIMLMDYKNGAGAEVEFTMPEIAGPKLALAIPGAVSTAGSIADAGGTPGSTTLALAAAIGDTSVKVVAITNFAAGDYMRISATGTLAEYRQITTAGTAGAGGTGLQFRDPLLKVHALADVVVESVGDGKTEITASTVRRQPVTAYNDWALVAQSPSSYFEFYAYNAISTTEGVEFAFGDETMAAIRVTLGARKDGANLTLPSWKLRVP